MRASLRVNNDVAVADFVELAVVAEEAGFDQLWVSNDLFLRSAPVLLAAAATATRRIALGVGILNPYSMHPAEIAMTAATLAELSGGRFLLGIGAGAEDFLGWAGIARPAPLTRTREAIVALRALLGGDRPARDPDAGPGWTDGAHLRLPPADVPIYVGGMSPRMLAMAGAHADGVLPLLFPPEHYATAAEQVRGGVLAAGRPAAAVDVAACIWCSMDPDRERARAALAEKIAYYGPSFAPYLLQRAGLTPTDFAGIRAAVEAGDLAAASAQVDERMLRLGVAGDAGDVVTRCRGLLAAGATHLSFGPPLGPDPLTAVRRLGTDVLPALRAEVRSGGKRADGRPGAEGVEGQGEVAAPGGRGVAEHAGVGEQQHRNVLGADVGPQ